MEVGSCTFYLISGGSSGVLTSLLIPALVFLQDTGHQKFVYKTNFRFFLFSIPDIKYQNSGNTEIRNLAGNLQFSRKIQKEMRFYHHYL